MNGLKIFLGVLLGLILVGIVNLGIHTFYPEPDYSDYCRYDIYAPWNNDNLTKENITYQQQCDDDYSQDNESYSNKIFYVLIVIGFILFILGVYTKQLSFQIMNIGSGAILMLEGVMRSLSNRYLAFGASIIIFIIIVYIIYIKVEKKISN